MTKARRAARHRAKSKRHKAAQPAGRVVVPLEGMGDIRQLAELCQVSPKTVRRLVEAAILPPPIRLGPRTVRWDMAQVRALLTAAANGQTPMPTLPEPPAPAPPKKRTTRRGAKRTRTRARPIEQPAANT